MPATFSFVDLKKLCAYVSRRREPLCVVPLNQSEGAEEVVVNLS
jgi:hypothetical protein